MLDIHKLNRIKHFNKLKVRNLLVSPGIEKFKEPFLEQFGAFSVKKFNESTYFETSDNIIFCTYPTALGLCKSFGVRSEIVLKEDLWRIKYNGKWYDLCERLGFVSEERLNKAKKILKLEHKLYLRWPIDNPRDPIVITNGKHAIITPPSSPKIIKESLA